MKSAIVILAAGSSSRLGQAKQLLPFKGTTLIRYVIQECVDSQLGPVVTILGSDYGTISEHIADLDCEVIVNGFWSEGLSSSISFGVQHLAKLALDNIIIVLADQPFFTKAQLHDLVTIKSNSSHKIIAIYLDG